MDEFIFSLEKKSKKSWSGDHCPPPHGRLWYILRHQNKEREKKKKYIYIYIYTHIKFTEFKMVKDLPPSSPVPAEEFAWPWWPETHQRPVRSSNVPVLSTMHKKFHSGPDRHWMSRKKEINVNKIKVVTLRTSYVTGISKWCSGRALSPSQPVANHQVRMWMWKWMCTPTNLQTTVMGPFPECCCHFSTFAIKVIRPAAGGSSFSFTHPLYWKIFIRRLFSGVWEYKSKSVFFFFFFFFF